MADITKCKGKDCPIKETCYRYTATANEFRQSYFTETPIKNGECECYWENLLSNKKNKKNNDK